ncbi:MAG: DUF1588 domain-containing protein [Polyangiales bacterium]
MHLRIQAALAALAALAGTFSASCLGNLGSSDGTGGDGPAPTVGVSTGGATTVGVYPFRRLTALQYDNTVRDLLGDGSNLATQKFTGDGLGDSGFSSPGLVTTLDVERFKGVAELLAQNAIPRIAPTQLLPCDPAIVGEDTCADRFITAFATRAFRRPLTADEASELKALYTSARTGLGSDFQGAIRLLIEALLQSPQFLYNGATSSGPKVTDSGLARLDPYELASRLSYFLQSTMPDDLLFAAAASGQLVTDSDVEQQARRLLASPKASDTLNNFLIEWLKLGSVTKLLKVDPAFTDAVKIAALGETKTFFNYVVLQGDARLTTLLTAPFSFVNRDLAPFYGVTSAGSTSFEKVPLENRYGLLTQVSVLASGANAVEDNAILRGKLVREGLLCQPLQPPPPGIPPLKPPTPGVSLRERHSEHMKVSPCSSCHTGMDPIGFGFGNYGASGRYQTLENGIPIDVSGTVFNIDGRDKPYKGARELTTLLSQSDEVKRCVTKQWFRFAFGRAETPDDDPSVKGISEVFNKSDGNVRELMVAIVKSASFRHRH